MASLGHASLGMARPARLSQDARGVVYVEFLIAFIPVFLFFLSICQLILLTTARLLVSHAAVAAARSAIVVLEDTYYEYGGAPRGNLTFGKSAANDWGGLLPLGTENAGYFTQSAGSQTYYTKSGARMAAIRMAAVLPLLTLAPKAAVAASSVSQSLVNITTAQLAFSYNYSQAATAVSLVQGESSDEPVTQPVSPKDSVTVSVRYLFHCSVPVIRNIMCRPLSSLVDLTGTSANNNSASDGSFSFGNMRAFSRLVSEGAQFVVLAGRATLTNQGADYLKPEDK